MNIVKTYIVEIGYNKFNFTSGAEAMAFAETAVRTTQDEQRIKICFEAVSDVDEIKKILNQAPILRGDYTNVADVNTISNKEQDGEHDTVRRMMVGNNADEVGV